MGGGILHDLAPDGARRRTRHRAFLSHEPSLVCRAARLPQLLSRGPPRPRTTPTRPPRSRCRPGRRRPAGRPPSPRFRRLHENPYAHTAHRASPDGDLYSDGRCLPPGGGRSANARGLGACVWARAPKPEQTLSLQGSRYVDLSAFPSVFRRPCLLYTSPSPRDLSTSRMPSSA